MVHNPFAVKVGTPTRSMADSTDHKESRPILAPATLVLGRCHEESETTANSVSSSFRLKPPILNNPFLKVDTSASAGKKPDSSEVSTTREEPDVSSYPDTGQDKKTSPLQANVKHEGGLRKTSFVLTKSSEVIATSHAQGNSMVAGCREFSLPTGNTSPSSKENIFTSFIESNSSGASSNRNSPPALQSSGFVFGQNMNERVVNAKTFDAVTNGSPALSFSCREKVFGNINSQNCEGNNSVEQYEPPKETVYNSDKQVKSLTESALEYESRQVKRTYEEVAIVTGEEDESNVLQMNCKLFTFDKQTSSWVEKGRGLLRLNDKELDDGSIQSRLVARTQGSLRVVLNTKIWAGMSVDRPSLKSVRLTAMDGETMRVFLISGSTKDIDQLFGALDWRVTTLKTSEERKVTETSTASIAVPSSVTTAVTSISSASFTTCDETISSSGTSPPSPSSAYAIASGSSGSSANSSNVASPLIATDMLGTSGDMLGPKKRRISPPSALDEEDSCLGSSSADSRVQERRVDSTENIDSNSCDGE